MSRNFGLTPSSRGKLGERECSPLLSEDQRETVMAIFLCITATCVGSFFGIAWFVASMLIESGSVP